MIEITDEMCRRALAAMEPDRIQGFSTPSLDRRKWGPPHWVLDTHRQPGEQELWRGNDCNEMYERCRIEEMRLALQAALRHGQSEKGE